MSEDAHPKKLIIITAPSGSGKTTIVKELLSSLPQLAFSVSATTRPPRKNEVDGVDYHFMTVEDFERKIEENAFAEYEMVYENKFYGTLKTKLSEIWQSKKFPLVDIDVQGAQKLKELYGHNAASIFIQAPSIAVLKERLTKRGTDTEEMIAERLEKANSEMQMSAAFDYVVINDDLAKAVMMTKNIITDFLN